MVATVTVSTITALAAVSLTSGIVVFITMLLISSLIGKELLRASTGSRQKLLSRSLYISIIPLIICFAAIVGLKVADILA